MDQPPLPVQPIVRGGGDGIHRGGGFVRRARVAVNAVPAHAAGRAQRPQAAARPLPLGRVIALPDQPVPAALAAEARPAAPVIPAQREQRANPPRARRPVADAVARAPGGGAELDPVRLAHHHPFPFGLTSRLPYVPVVPTLIGDSIFPMGLPLRVASDTPNYDAARWYASAYIRDSTAAGCCLQIEDPFLPYRPVSQLHANQVVLSHVWDPTLFASVLEHVETIYASVLCFTTPGQYDLFKGEVSIVVDPAGVHAASRVGTSHYLNPAGLASAQPEYADCGGRPVFVTRLAFVAGHAFYSIQAIAQPPANAVLASLTPPLAEGPAHVLYLSGTDNRSSKDVAPILSYTMPLVGVHQVPEPLLNFCVQMLVDVPDVNYSKFMSVYRRSRATVASLSEAQFANYQKPTYYATLAALHDVYDLNVWTTAHQWFYAKVVQPGRSLMQWFRGIRTVVMNQPRSLIGVVVLLAVVMYAVWTTAPLGSLLPGEQLLWILWAIALAPLVEEYVVWRARLAPAIFVYAIFVAAHFLLPNYSWVAALGISLCRLVQPDSLFWCISVHYLWNWAVALVFVLTPGHRAWLSVQTYELLSAVCSAVPHSVAEAFDCAAKLQFFFAQPVDHYHGVNAAFEDKKSAWTTAGCPAQHEFVNLVGASGADTYRAVQCGSFYGANFAAAPAATLVFAALLWLTNRVGVKAARMHAAWCTGTMRVRRTCERHGHKLSAIMGRHACHPSYYSQVGPDLPGHTPMLLSACSHNVAAGVTRRMMADIVYPDDRTDDDITRELLSYYPSVRRYFDTTALTWDWDGFIAGKARALVQRANRGRLSLLAKGAVLTPNLVVLPADVETVVKLFVKREFYDYDPTHDKPAKPRIISGCSDEVLAILGPYFHSLDKKLKTFPGIVKHLAAYQLSGRAREIVDQAATWRKRVVSTDLSTYDRTQVRPLMRVQHFLYKQLGMPDNILAFLAAYDLQWEGRAYCRDDKANKLVLRWASQDGCRKTGDPQTSAGNNLFHWYMIHAALAHYGQGPDDACFMINGDDFMGTFRVLTFTKLASFYKSVGLAIERGESLEFCGGNFMGDGAIFVRDPARALFKFGWSKYVEPEPLAFIASVAQGQTYIATKNPIYSALLKLAMGFTRRRIQLRAASISWVVQEMAVDLTAPSSTFSTEIPFDVRVDYAMVHGIMPGAQMSFEEDISKLTPTGSLPLLLGRLL